MKHRQDYTDRLGLRVARAALQVASVQEIREKSLANLDRWNGNGVWVPDHDAWRELMKEGTEDEVIAVMTGTDPRAVRLRRSSPYVGLISDTTRMYLRETRLIENDADVSSACEEIDRERLARSMKMLETHNLATIREKGIDFLNRLRSVAEGLSATQEVWAQLLSSGSDAELVTALTETNSRGMRLRLVHPFGELFEG